MEEKGVGKSVKKDKFEILNLLSSLGYLSLPFIFLDNLQHLFVLFQFPQEFLPRTSLHSTCPSNQALQVSPGRKQSTRYNWYSLLGKSISLCLANGE